MLIAVGLLPLLVIAGLAAGAFYLGYKAGYKEGKKSGESAGSKNNGGND